MNEELVSIESVTSVEIMEAQQRAEYDVQIATAKKYPRDLTRVRNNCVAIATMDKQTAESCRYAVPRAGKNISGPSVHLARIIAQQYGNLRADAKIKAVTDKEVISEAVAFDLETNYAVKVEVRKRIVDKFGKRYKDDMIVVTGNAANAVAFRNAIFNVVPKTITDACYNAAIETMTGDLSDETKLIQARNKALKALKDEYNATEDEVLKALGLNTVNQIKQEQIVDLRGIYQSLKDGETTPDEAFNRVSGEKTAASPAANGAKDLFDNKTK